MDAILVRNGELVGLCLAGLVTLIVLGAWVLLRVRARRAKLVTRLGPLDRLREDAEIGRTVVLEGTLREGTRVESFVEEGRSDEVLATSARIAMASASTDGELVAKRGRDLGLVVEGRRLRVVGEVEVVASPDPRLLPAAARKALAGAEREGASIEGLPIEEHVVLRGMRVTVRAKLEREESAYRGGGFVLVATSEGPPRLTPSRPSPRSLVRGGAIVATVTLPLVLLAGQVATRSLGDRVRRELVDARPRESTVEELPLGWAHRIALLGHRPDDALRAFDRLLAHDHTSPALLVMAADAHTRRGDCAGAITVFASHGAFELGRAYTARCNLGPAVLVARAELERMDGEIETALSWIDRNTDDALAVPRPREERHATASFRAQLLIEAGRYDEAARELEARVRPTLSRHAGGPPARSIACLTIALSPGGGRLPRDATLACELLRFELEDVSPSEWWDDDVGDLRWAGAAAAHASHHEPFTLQLGPPSSWHSLGAVVHGEQPRWNGLVAAALAAARAGEGPARDTVLCHLERAEAVHRYARTGEMTPPSEVCLARGDERMSLVAIDHGGAGPPDGSLASALAFRDAPSLETLRAAARWLHPPREIGFLGEAELCAAGCVRGEVEDEGGGPETPLERAAIAGDARALRALVPDGLALRLARTHRDEVIVWATHRLRARGGPTVRLERLRDDAYADLWLARLAGDDEAITRVGARLDRFEAVLSDRRRAVLLEALFLAL